MRAKHDPACHLLRWISQVEHLGRADADTLRAANLLRGQLGRGYYQRPRLKLGHPALITMIYIIDRIAEGGGFRHGFSRFTARIQASDLTTSSTCTLLEPGTPVRLFSG